MSAGWVDAMRRLAGGLILLFVMSFAVAPAASAHGALHDRIRQAAQRNQAATSVMRAQDAHVAAATPAGLPARPAAAWARVR